MHDERDGTCGAGRHRLFGKALPTALGLGLLIRLALLATPRSYQADEIFQYLEQAHRLVFGYGVIPWEYRLGIRSWLFPILLAGPMALGNWLAPGSSAYLLLPKLSLVLLSLGVIWAAHGFGRRISPLHGAIAALVAAFWSELALFATQALTDSAALPLFFSGAALLYQAPSARRSAASGALLALACLIRVEDTPAILGFVALICRSDRQRWSWGLAGALPVLLLGGLVDIAMGQSPFGWVAANVHENVVVGRSHQWGVEKPIFYLKALTKIWSIALLPLIGLAWLGARRYPALAIMAAGNIALHSLIAHKEYRYILLSTTAIVILAAIGSGDLIARLRERRPNMPWFGIMLAVWMAASAGTARARFTAYDWSQATPSLEAFERGRVTPAICGIAVHGIWWSHTGAYAYLHRPVPIYLPDLAGQPGKALVEGAASFNAIIAPPGIGSIPAAYRVERCFGQAGRYPDQAACLYLRPGRCDAAPARSFEINRALASTDR